MDGKPFMHSPSSENTGERVTASSRLICANNGPEQGMDDLTKNDCCDLERARLDTHLSRAAQVEHPQLVAAEEEQHDEHDDDGAHDGH